MNKTKPLMLSLLLLSALPALASEAALRQCRSIADGAKRLACYDALPLGSAAAVAATPMAAAPTAAPATPATPATPAAPAKPAEQFGLRAPSSAAAETLESEITGAFEGWQANQQLRLANGQIWRIADGSSAFYALQNPKVRIRRGVLGAFYMEIEGVNQAPRVVRLR